MSEKTVQIDGIDVDVDKANIFTVFLRNLIGRDYIILRPYTY